MVLKKFANSKALSLFKGNLFNHINDFFVAGDVHVARPSTSTWLREFLSSGI